MVVDGDKNMGPSWADQVEQGEDGLPPSSVEYDKNGVKIVTEYKKNEEGQKVKIVKQYKVETIKVSKSIAKRKMWRKFGGAAGDAPGPNTANTNVAEDVFMQFVHTKEALDEAEAGPDALARFKVAKNVVCRICKGDHWTAGCPYKDTLAPVTDLSRVEDGVGGSNPGTPPNELKSDTATPRAAPGKYVPPSMRGTGERKPGEAMSTRPARDDNATIRVTNLSEETRENDLQELFRPFGHISRIYLAKDKMTGASKGFAFINYQRKEDAARAIDGVSGFGYDHLILKVEWAKPSGNA